MVWINNLFCQSLPRLSDSHYPFWTHTYQCVCFTCSKYFSCCNLIPKWILHLHQILLTVLHHGKVEKPYIWKNLCVWNVLAQMQSGYTFILPVFKDCKEYHEYLCYVWFLQRFLWMSSVRRQWSRVWRQVESPSCCWTEPQCWCRPMTQHGKRLTCWGGWIATWKLPRPACRGASCTSLCSRYMHQCADAFGVVMRYSLRSLFTSQKILPVASSVSWRSVKLTQSAAKKGASSGQLY